jgi:hypothetical protein
MNDVIVKAAKELYMTDETINLISLFGGEIPEDLAAKSYDHKIALTISGEQFWGEAGFSILDNGGEHKNGVQFSF